LGYLPFSPGRTYFNELVALTYAGDVNAWLCWHPNRLSRNPIDAGTIVYLMDLGLLHHIKTPTRVYFNNPTDKMMLNFEFTMSKKDSDDKSGFVKSGLKKRYKKGLPTGKAPIGFLNDKTKEKGDRGWLVDEERFPISQTSSVRSALKGLEDMLLEQHLSCCVVDQIKSGKEKKAVDEIIKVYKLKR